VRFLGVLTHREVAEYLTSADVVVVPSVRDDQGNVDGLPNFLLEALASGTAVVTTQAGGIGSVVSNRVTAAVVGERDVNALATAIQELLSHPEQRGALGAAARAAAIASGGWNRYAERLEQLYEKSSQ
jgi:glycosyltransferase involved in cell wall biosynthesis